MKDKPVSRVSFGNLSFIGNGSLWKEESSLTRLARTRGDEEKRHLKDATVFALTDIEKQYQYYVMINKKHDILFDTSDFNEMFCHIETLKNS